MAAGDFLANNLDRNVRTSTRDNTVSRLIRDLRGEDWDNLQKSEEAVERQHEGCIEVVIEEREGEINIIIIVIVYGR